MGKLNAIWRRATNDLLVLSCQTETLTQNQLLDSILERLLRRFRCRQATYLKCTWLRAKGDFMVTGRTLPSRPFADLPARELLIFGRTLVLPQGASRQTFKAVQSFSGKKVSGLVVQLAYPDWETQHIISLTLSAAAEFFPVERSESKAPFQFLTLLANALKSVGQFDVERRRGTRMRVVERIMQKTGTVREVVPEICLALREFVGAPVIRLWVLNRQFNDLDLLYVSAAPDFQDLIRLTRTRLSGRSLGMKAIKQGEVIRQLRPWELAGWEQDVGLENTLAALPAMVCIPVISADSREDGSARLIGLIDAHHDPTSPVLEDDDFLLFLGKHTAAGLLRSRSFERFEVTAKLNKKALQLVNPKGRKRLQEQRDTYLSEVLEITRDALNANCVSIFEADDTGAALKCVATTGICSPPEGPILYRGGGDVTWEVFVTGQQINKQKLEEGLLFSEERELIDPEIDPLLAVPLAGEHRPIGVIRVREKKWHYDENRQQRFSTHDILILATIAASVSPILQMLRMQAHREVFIERTAHQVIQPLQGVIAYTSNILDGLYDVARRDMKLRYIRQMARACAGMMRSNVWLSGVTDFTDLRDTVRREPRKLTEYFIDRIIDLQPIRELEGIRVQLVNEDAADTFGEFMTDEVFFDQVMQNILHNAVKYSYPNTTVRVYLEKTGQDLEVLVASIGVPIPLSERERIFWDRERGTIASSYDHIGTGQGLYIAREIMRGLGGDITLLDNVPEPRIKAPSGFPPAERSTFKIFYEEAFKGED